MELLNVNMLDPSGDFQERQGDRAGPDRDPRGCVPAERLQAVEVAA